MSFASELRDKYNSGVVESNIYFDSKQARFRVKIASNWIGSYYSLRGARAARDSATLKATKDREVKRLKNKLTAIVEKERKTRIQIERYTAALAAHSLEYNETIREIGYLEEQARRGAT